jgi:hypothetical protein
MGDWLTKIWRIGRTHRTANGTVNAANGTANDAAPKTSTERWRRHKEKDPEAFNAKRRKRDRRRRQRERGKPVAERAEIQEFLETTLAKVRQQPESPKAAAARKARIEADWFVIDAVEAAKRAVEAEKAADAAAAEAEQEDMSANVVPLHRA